MITREKNELGLTTHYQTSPISNTIYFLFPTTFHNYLQRNKNKKFIENRNCRSNLLYNIPHIKKTGNRILAVLPSSQCYLNIFTPAHLNDFQNYSENDYSGNFSYPHVLRFSSILPSPKKQIQVLQHLH